MKNALDEIKCVPVLGGQKPPYRTISHPYCIDIITTYVELSKRPIENKDEYLKLIEDGILFYCNSNKIDFAFHFENKLPLTIPSTVNNFQWFLAAQIISFDTNKIKALLSFQQKRFPEEETDFVTFVEFAVYNMVKNSTRLKNEEHLKMIMEWVNEQRTLNHNSGKFEVVQKETDSKEVNRTTKKRKPQKVKIIPLSFSLLALKNNPKYFEKNASNLVEAFQLLKGGGFISNEATYEWFKGILQGKEVNRANRIEWTGKVIELKMFVDLLMKKKIAIIKHNKWETVTNCFMKDGIDLLADNIRKANGKPDNEQKLIDIVHLI